MKPKTINGLSLIGIALTATGLFANAQGWGKWCLILSAFLLTTLGLIELFINK